MQLSQLKRTANQREAGQSSWVELYRYKRAFKENGYYFIMFDHTAYVVLHSAWPAEM